MSRSSYPLVSIAITSYNYGRFVQRAIRSALDQNYPNVEVIVCDNASTDDSAAKIGELAEADARVRVFRNEQNIGAVPNHNLALSKCLGEYVVILSADDCLFPGHLRSAVNYYALHPDCDLRSTGWVAIDDAGNATRHINMTGQGNIASFSGRRLLEDMFCFFDHVLLPSIVFPRRLFDRYGFMSEEAEMPDTDFMFRLASAGLKFAYDATPYVGMYYHDASMSSPTTYVHSGQKLRGLLDICNTYLTEDACLRLAGRKQKVAAMLEGTVRRLGEVNPAGRSAILAANAVSLSTVQRRIETIPNRMKETTEGVPRVSVIIPTLGRIGLLRASLSSVYAQSWQSWEVIVVANGGAPLDPIVGQLPCSDRMILARTIETGNAAAARNVGVRLASGEIIAYLNEGERWSESYLERVCRCLDEHDADVTRACGVAVFYDGDGDRVGQEIARDAGFFPAPREPFVDDLGFYTSLGTIAHRRYCLERTGGFDEALPLLEDWEFAMRLVGAGGFRIFDIAGSDVEVPYRKFLTQHALRDRLAMLPEAMRHIHTKHSPNDQALAGRRNERLQEISNAGWSLRRAADASAMIQAYAAIKGRRPSPS